MSDDERVRVETVITRPPSALPIPTSRRSVRTATTPSMTQLLWSAARCIPSKAPEELGRLSRRSAAVAALDAQIERGSRPPGRAFTGFLIALAAPTRPAGAFIPVPNLTYVRLYDADWFKQVERAYNELRDIPTYAPATLAAVISTAQTHLKSDPLPAPAQIAVENYLTSVTRLGAERAALEAALRSLNSSIDSAVRDIMEESELD